MQSYQTDNKELLIKMVLSNWELQLNRTNDLLERLSDEELSCPTAPGRNTGAYLLGHLAAVSDGMFIFLGLGQRVDAEMDEVFVDNPESADIQKPAVSQIREYWKKVNALLAEKMDQMKVDDWFAAHTAISEESFAKEPHRNKLNIVLNRTNHLSYHLGQLVYLAKK
jgi:hypothetical protein